MRPLGCSLTIIVSKPDSLNFYFSLFTIMVIPSCQAYKFNFLISSGVCIFKMSASSSPPLFCKTKENLISMKCRTCFISKFMGLCHFPLVLVDIECVPAHMRPRKIKIHTHMQIHALKKNQNLLNKIGCVVFLNFPAQTCFLTKK